MNANSVVTTMPGASSGAITVRSTYSLPAPSTIAASSSSRGMLRMKPRRVQTQNGSANVR